MPRDTHASLDARKSELESGGLINLFEVETQRAINATPSQYEYWAEFNATVSYFIPGTDTPQDYSPTMIMRSEIVTDDGSKAPSLEVTIGNVNQVITAYVENNDALRRNRVRVTVVPIDELNCASACMTDTFYIDGCNIDHGEEVAQFSLTSKGQVDDVTVPLRRFRRDYCYKMYNGSDCRATSIPASMVLPPFSDRKCRHTKDACASKGNVINFGGFPGIGYQR